MSSSWVLRHASMIAFVARQGLQEEAVLRRDIPRTQTSFQKKAALAIYWYILVLVMENRGLEAVQTSWSTLTGGERLITMANSSQRGTLRWMRPQKSRGRDSQFLGGTLPCARLRLRGPGRELSSRIVRLISA